MFTRTANDKAQVGICLMQDGHRIYRVLDPLRRMQFGKHADPGPVGLGGEQLGTCSHAFNMTFAMDSKRQYLEFFPGKGNPSDVPADCVRYADRYVGKPDGKSMNACNAYPLPKWPRFVERPSVRRMDDLSDTTHPGGY